MCAVNYLKEKVVHYIRKKLPRGYKQLGKQTVSVPATEISANQILANILEMQEWGIKFYEQQQLQIKIQTQAMIQ
ncbi:hypothetical protein C1645_835994 [Glomus cerebriforme]|uniref:Uncharacterized protein n=1 Tax=Glomus cerebriforme TaxID=658196 RepID=A0A397S954_9GLOM|nr:hypothetical protein C1645_835994 [Glomus cerebriforme]